MAMNTASIPRPALVLGLGGLLPFFASAIAVCMLAGNDSPSSASSDFFLLSLGGYGAVILSFLGGIRWGKLLGDDVLTNQWGPLSLSVVPSLIAWPALLLGGSLMLLLLATGFAIQYALDRAAVERHELPAWFGRLRLILTSGAIVSLLSAWVALQLAG